MKERAHPVRQGMGAGLPAGESPKPVFSLPVGTTAGLLGGQTV